MITFIRRDAKATGGAQSYLARMVSELQKREVACEVVDKSFPRMMPSWVKVSKFDEFICAQKEDRFYFSFDRINCPDIYRAGDGVHRAFMQVKGFSLNPLNRIYLKLEERSFKNAKKIIANSKMVKAQIMEHYEIDEAKIEVVYNGIELKHIDYEKAKKKIRKKYAIPEDRPTILFVGNGFERKGLADFLQTIGLLSHDFFAIVVGKDKNQKRFEAMRDEMGLKSKVLFLGEVKELDEIYATSDIFLFPTHYEPFSNVVLEALSFKNVVFTTAQNGASEILDEQFVMKNPADKSVVRKIDRLLDEPDELNGQQVRARLLATNYTIEKSVDATLKVIDALTH